LTEIVAIVLATLASAVLGALITRAAQMFWPGVLTRVGVRDIDSTQPETPAAKYGGSDESDESPIPGLEP
jgi:hypothetical protein